MTRIACRTLVLTIGAGLLLASPSSAAGFKYGVTAGEISSGSAIVWARSDKAGRVVLQVARDRRFRRSLKLYLLRARSSDDYTVQRRVSRLAAGKRYYYRFLRGRSKSATGTFVTAPRSSSTSAVEFGYTGDTDFSPAPGQTRPYWNNGEIFQRLRAERNHFNIHFGDTIYSDSEVPGRLNPIALSVRQKWAKYKTNLGNRQLRALRSAAGFYSHWDDHEFVNDFSPNENTFSNNVNIDGRTLYNRGVAAFRDYAPVRYTSTDGLYRSVRWGANVELFFLDQRSFRSAKADEGGVCNNPQTGQPDDAPTAPQTTRNTFGAIFPSTGLSQPVSPACLAAIRSPSRTYLGRRQMTRFKAAINRSKATWKIIMNELAIQQYYVLPYDRWEGYEAERQELLRFLQGNVKNTIFLTTDVHATMVNDARLQTLEPGGPVNSGIFDFTAGSAATANYSLEIDTSTGQPGAGTLVTNGFFKPQPPNGVGMRCAVTDKFGYGQVRATRSTLTITAKGLDGKPYADCQPLVLSRR